MGKRRKLTQILIVIIVFIVGYQVGGWIETSTNPDAEKVEQVLNITKNYYLEKISSDSLSENAIEGILSKLDPHTTYIPKDIQTVLEEQMHGSFEGIGVEFQIIDDTINVVTPIVGGPSETLGIQPGDRIISINDSSAIGISNSEVVKRLRGEKGTEVQVTIYRPSIDEVNTYTIVRDEIPLNSVEVALMVDDSVGYVNVSRFAERTNSELKNALSELDSAGMQYLILDLRNNPGGLLNQSISMADLFISGDKLIVFTKGRLQEFNEEFRSSEKSEYEDLPLVIMINRGSASASEIVSGAVQDWDRGLIVGETSFGKGLVQRPFVLNDGSVIRLTISKYYTPSGRAIQRDYRDRESYYREVAERDNDSLQHTADSLHEVKFTTANGRIVYEKGGIEPDNFVENENLTKITVNIRSRNLFYRFIRKQLDSHKIIIDDRLQSDLNLFRTEFYITGNHISEFKSFVKNEVENFNEDEFEKDLSYIKDMLRAHIAREFFNSKGWYTILLNQDKPFQDAMKLLQKAKIMVNEKNYEEL